MSVPKLDVSHDLGRLVAQFELLHRETMPAAARALNRTMTTVRAEAARELAKEYRGLKIGAIKRRIRQTVRATRSNPRGELAFSASRIPLLAFALQRRPTRWGTGIYAGNLPERLVRIDLASKQARPVSRGELRSAFVQRTRRGVASVWLRQGPASWPFDVLAAPSLARTITERHIDQALLRLARARFATAFAQEARRARLLREH